jgi:hypothetical protein
MEIKISLDNIYKPSQDIVAREVQGEFIIIPVTSEVVDSEDQIFSLNETGKAVWDRLDGKRSLKSIVNELGSIYEGSYSKIKQDVMGIVKELLKRKIVIEVRR